ncbi:hypothetical protein BGW36DRAFT_421586 [Talaromyces proteolyticus]|uniref:NmrA-like domain-containing protein n=1 Tax=Talaromyces proteolyticus TaxID=1131652 RepID=A0AAD4L316_9EURO|nr:uncharacterized protein BGW36DRAFT_421586 [Talaromyces proteolyticus]KAH8705007.1 hypothetical protein BGW36DRAFT_421586 [Talaromyces proteolyticus]
MSRPSPVLVTGAAGQLGGVGAHVVSHLLSANTPVRALVVVADLTNPEEISSAVHGCRRVFFSTSVSPQYLEATAVLAAAARATPGGIELLVNMSQMTVSQLDITHSSSFSPQHRLQWLSEQVLNWSGVPVTHLRPTVFHENPLFWSLAAKSLTDTPDTITLPFGRSLISPIAAADVGAVAAKVLLEPDAARYAGRVLELTGPRAEDMYSLVEEYSAGLGRLIRYEEIPLETWREKMLAKSDMSEHVVQHVLTMARLHAEGKYDRYTSTVEDVLGRPAVSISKTIREGKFPIS